MSIPLNPRPPRIRRAAPCCGACGYDTTGLTSLTCPECGADLRAAGITRGRRAGTWGGFVVSSLLLVICWTACGLIVSPVLALYPQQFTRQQTVSFSGPASGAYKGVDVAASLRGWGDARPQVAVELRLLPSGGPAPARAVPYTQPSNPPPAPLSVAPGVTPAAVAAWLASAGVNTADPRVAAEAEALALAAQRALRTRQRETGAVTFSRSSFTAGGGGPFSSVSIAAGGSTTPGRLALALFAALWLAVLAAGLLHLWRTTRPGMPMAKPQ